MTASITTQATEASDVETHLKHEPPKRNKTWGEHVFNWRTYAGIALIGNEASSLLITEATQKPGRPLYDTYQKFAGFFRDLGSRHSFLSEYIVGSETKTELYKAEKLKPRLPYLLAATVGGMLMVPFVKYAEDHKGEQVRKLDRKHYGTLSDSDPKLVEAHKEMDEAPKQSWGSLMKGRVTTVVAAIAADYTFGWDYALTTKFGKEISLNGLSRKVADLTVNLFMPKVAKSLKTKESIAIIEEFKTSKLAPVGETAIKTIESFKKAESLGAVAQNATWLLALSSTLTVLFYASSKLFAKKQEEKVERKQEQLVARAHGTHADGIEDALESVSAEQAEAKPVNETPTPQVKNIRREETVTSVPQLSQGA